MKKPLFTLVAFLVMMTMSAQVGVNNSNPAQALDVNGKIKLTDDSTNPTAGTMRYNNTDNSFEGYDGTQWNSFTTRQSGALPSNPVPMRGYTISIVPGDKLSLTFKDWLGNYSFQTPPAGKLLIITSIYATPYFFSEYNLKFQAVIGVSESLNALNANIGENGLGIFVDPTVSAPITGDGAPLFVVSSGQFLTGYSSTGSAATGIIFNVRGFLVDDLNY